MTTQCYITYTNIWINIYIYIYLCFKINIHSKIKFAIMKNVKLISLITIMLLTTSIGSIHAMNFEEEEIITETVKLSGIEMADALNEDGTDIIKRPYKWFAGIGKADNKQVAIEIAQREAYATISRILNNAIKDGAQKGNLINDSRVRQALNSHWEQVSESIQKACEPFGDTSIKYNSKTRMYEATSKIGIRGDRFNQMLNSAADFEPSNLTGEELNQFIQTNKSIMEAAKGN